MLYVLEDELFGSFDALVFGVNQWYPLLQSPFKSLNQSVRCLCDWIHYALHQPASSMSHNRQLLNDVYIQFPADRIDLFSYGRRIYLVRLNEICAHVNFADDVGPYRAVLASWSGTPFIREYSNIGKLFIFRSLKGVFITRRASATTRNFRLSNGLTRSSMRLLRYSRLFSDDNVIPGFW